MRVITLVAALLAPAAFAQTETPKGFTDTYAPATTDTNTPATPVTGGSATSGTPSALPFGGPLPEANTGPGLNIVGPDGATTKTARASPCNLASRETDCTTTCVRISKGAK